MLFSLVTITCGDTIETLPTRLLLLTPRFLSPALNYPIGKPQLLLLVPDGKAVESGFARRRNPSRCGTALTSVERNSLRKSTSTFPPFAARCVLWTPRHYQPTYLQADFLRQSAVQTCGHNCAGSRLTAHQDPTASPTSSSNSSRLKSVYQPAPFSTPPCAQVLSRVSGSMQVQKLKQCRYNSSRSESTMSHWQLISPCWIREVRSLFVFTTSQQ